MLTNAVKSAHFDSPKDAPGDYHFIEEVFYRQTEPRFQATLRIARQATEANTDADDPLQGTRQQWREEMVESASELFDHFAPSDGLEDRDMQRLVKASYFFHKALRGYDKEGRSLFSALDIPLPTRKEAA